MAIMLNCTEETQTVKVVGNYFTFKPGQIKQMSDDIARFIVTDKKESGIVTLPEKFEDLSERETEEGRAEIATLRRAGLEQYLNHLRSLVHNNQVSLRRDLEQANIKIDPASMATDGELNALRTLARYQAGKEDEGKKRAEEMKQLMKELDKK